MFDVTQDLRPLLLKVNEETWRIVFVNGEPDPTDREVFLHELLVNSGGIPMSMPPGFYHYQALPYGPNHHKISLTMINN